MRNFPLLFRFSLCTLFPCPLPLSAFLHIARFLFLLAVNWFCSNSFAYFPSFAVSRFTLWGIRPCCLGLGCGFVRLNGTEPQMKCFIQNLPTRAPRGVPRKFQFIEQISYHSTHNGCCDFLLQTCQQIVFLNLPPLQPVP